MARPNLSFEHLALTLAVLGVGCAKSEPASVQSDRANASATAATPPPPPEQGAAKFEGDKGREPTPIAAPNATATASVPGGAASAHEQPKRKKDSTGQASCGAGTCTADMKKK